MGKITHAISKFFTLILKAYQYLLSPLLRNCCRFHPSCSSYAIEAIQAHGNLHGCYLSLRRILRCHPWNPGGIDLVPEKKPTC